MPVRRSTVGLTAKVGKGLGVAEGGNQTGVGVSVGLGVGVSVGGRETGETKQAALDNKSTPARNVFAKRKEKFTRRYYSEVHSP